MKEGGSYIKDKGKKPRLVERTKDHPEGNRPRDPEGKPLDVPPPTSSTTKKSKGKE